VDPSLPRSLCQLLRGWLVAPAPLPGVRLLPPEREVSVTRCPRGKHELLVGGELRGVLAGGQKSLTEDGAAWTDGCLERSELVQPGAAPSLERSCHALPQREKLPQGVVEENTTKNRGEKVCWNHCSVSA